MTTPAQAQIEALELIDTFAWSCVKTDCEESRVELQRRIDKCRAALTAAAEAGEQDTATEWINRVKFFEAADRHLRNATIERCAQVALRYAVNIGKYAHIIAAAIRAMKEGEPQPDAPDKNPPW